MGGVSPKDKEFFAAAGRDDIVHARTATIRARMIANLGAADAALHIPLLGNAARTPGYVNLLAASGRYPLAGVGTLTTHDLFTEHFRDLTATRGSSGLLIPTSLMTGAQTAPLVADLLSKQQLGAFYDFTNSGQIFLASTRPTDSESCTCLGRQRPSRTVRLAFHLTASQR
jgi:hypothetical protein